MPKNSGRACANWGFSKIYISSGKWLLYALTEKNTYGGLYGEEWDNPRIVPFGPGGRQLARVYPLGMWTTLRDNGGVGHAPQSYRDMRTGEVTKFLPREIHATGFANDVTILYGEYQAWHADLGTGYKGCLSRKSFCEVLKRKHGLRVDLQVRTPMRDRKRFVVPSDISDTQSFLELVDDVTAKSVFSGSFCVRSAHTSAEEKLASLARVAEREIPQLTREKPVAEQLRDMDKRSLLVLAVLGARVMDLIADPRVEGTRIILRSADSPERQV